MRMRTQTHNGKPSPSHRRSMPPPRGGRVVRLPEVIEITGLSRTTIWRRERDGSLRQRIHLAESISGRPATSTHPVTGMPPRRGPGYRATAASATAWVIFVGGQSYRLRGNRKEITHQPTH